MFYVFCFLFFFFNDTPTTEIYTLSLHDALPISLGHEPRHVADAAADHHVGPLQRDAAAAGRVALDHHQPAAPGRDRKSTRLNSSHVSISYAVFCLKKKKKKKNISNTESLSMKKN